MYAELQVTVIRLVLEFVKFTKPCEGVGRHAGVPYAFIFC